MSLKRSLKRTLWVFPSVYFMILRILRFTGRFGLVPADFVPPESYRTNGLVNRETELVIEGFPRSGNSFAVTAMRLSQERSLIIAHHFHVPAQIIYACRHGIPVLVIIRKASDAIISQKIRTSSGNLEQALMDWISFYECIMPYRDRFVLAGFEDITEDFGVVIDRINTKFGTCFSCFIHSKENCEEVFRRIETWSVHIHGKVEEFSIERPSSARQALKRELVRELESEKYSPLLEKAGRIYRAFISGGL
ncbi:MAG: hypothetical protein KAT09_00185 [Candidatus Aegiribacteria sp.]|nr:hypothetical protein [Candidatus Aegiribacteria sp.]